MPDYAAAEKTGSAEHGDDATVREADVRVMAVRLGKFANFLIKVERFTASIRYWTETGSKG